MSQSDTPRPLMLFKYGGNAMIKDSLKREVLSSICYLKESGYDVVIVHGGGPFIENILATAKIESEFVEGQRKTSKEALKYIEMALKGEVGGSIVNIINKLGFSGVSLSGKDGKIVTAKRRVQTIEVDGKEQEVDLGLVGDIESIDTTLIKLLLAHGYVPVITCIASDSEGIDYNINADILAGAIAGALGADQFVLLTDVDGIMKDKTDPATLIPKISLDEIEALSRNVIQGGMIPKVESAAMALNMGAKNARIINGTKPQIISSLTSKEIILGTIIYK